MNCVVKQSAARTHRSELTGSIVRRRRNPLALARGGGQDNRTKGEVDYLIDDYHNLSVVPIEVKSGRDYSMNIDYAAAIPLATVLVS
ncbi:hypothetical protein [Pelistega europaea]|uniref:DUF4143 domain-containing protein n=1 Tax=Pelistega europaea TaxID=106147 RepID=A0A7Y4P5P4_9BURK|nr:hypothetical protein [Pelistega europaea]NOL50008.1 hypothetical protein [Pelistega europaea]